MSKTQKKLIPRRDRPVKDSEHPVKGSFGPGLIEEDAQLFEKVTTLSRQPVSLGERRLWKLYNAA
jgi:hypothetical protein